MCEAVIYKHFSGEGRNAVEASLDKPEKQREWLVWVAEAESVARGEKRRAYNTAGKAEKRIESFQSQRLEMKRNLGVFWPEKLWNDHHPEQKASKKEIQAPPPPALSLQAPLGCVGAGPFGFCVFLARRLSRRFRSLGSAVSGRRLRQGRGLGSRRPRWAARGGGGGCAGDPEVWARSDPRGDARTADRHDLFVGD